MPPFLAEIPNYFSQFVLAQGVDQVGCGALLPGIHAHVQRASQVEAESPCSIIHLKRRHSEVQENAVHCLDMQPGQDRTN